MPDLDQLLDTVLADVSAGTRAPGAPAAINQAHRRRSKIAAAAALALIAGGSGLAAGTLGGSDRSSLVGEPTLPSPKPPVVQESAEALPEPPDPFRTELRKALAQAPGWTITDSDPTISHPCGGDWSVKAIGASSGSISIPSPGEWLYVWADQIGFPSAAQAADAAAVLADNLASCTTVPWRTQHIARTGTVLASSPLGVIWIHQKDTTVATLQVPTTDGPPPLAVQVEIADLIRSSIA